MARMHDKDRAADAPRRFPALAPWLTCGFSDGRVTIRNGEMVAVMEGPAVSRMLAAVTPLLDGRHTVEEIARASDIKLNHVQQVIAALEQADLIIDGAGLPRESGFFESAAVVASCWSQLVDVRQAVDRLDPSRVTLVGSDIVTRMVAEQLVHMGLACEFVANRATAAGELPDEVFDSDFLVVGPSVVHHTARSSNPALYKANVPWLPVFPFNGRYAAVGPLMVPPDSGCFECYVLRRHANVSYSAEIYDSVAQAGVASPVDYPPLDRASAATAAFMVHQWLAVRHPDMPGTSYLDRAGTWEREVHHLLRVPRCPVCGEASQQGIPAAWWSAP